MATGQILYLGKDLEQSGHLVVSGGTVGRASSSLLIYAGYAGEGTITQTGGSVAARITLGAQQSGAGTYDLRGGTLTPPQLIIGSTNGTGTFSHSGGTVSLGANAYPNAVQIGGPEGSVGQYLLSGTGSLDLTQFSGPGSGLRVGVAGAGSLIQTGGNVAIGQGNLLLGSSRGTGEYRLAGGTLTAHDSFAGNLINPASAPLGSGTFIQTGGTATMTNRLLLGRSADAQGAYQLYDGALSAPQIQVPAVQTSPVAYVPRALFSQHGGAATTMDLKVGATGEYRIDDGNLDVGHGTDNNGSMLVAGGNVHMGEVTGSLGSLSVTDGMAVAASIAQHSLSITGGRMGLTGRGTRSSVGVLDVSGPGTLDLGTGSIEISDATPSALASVGTALARSYDGGAWDGAGITSSAAALQPGTTIGVRAAVDAIVLKFTWVGDANLDGIVDAADGAAMEYGATDWEHGDFNYDGTVDADDYALFGIGAAIGTVDIANRIPEPHWAGAIAAAIVVAKQYRRSVETRSNRDA